MNVEEEALVPPGPLTVTSTVPLPAGEVAISSLSSTTTKLGEALEPKSTLVAPVKLVPIMVTDVPPVVGPLVGETAVTVGGAI